MRSKKEAAVDAANIGGSQAGTVWTDSIPKSHFIMFFYCTQEKRGVNIG